MEGRQPRQLAGGVRDLTGVVIHEQDRVFANIQRAGHLPAALGLLLPAACGGGKLIPLAVKVGTVLEQPADGGEIVARDQGEKDTLASEFRKPSLKRRVFS